MARRVKAKPGVAGNAAAPGGLTGGAQGAASAEAGAAMQGAAHGGTGEGGGGDAVSRPAPAASARPLVVVVLGPRKGRGRAGRYFTAEPVTIPLDDLSEDDKTALIGDPRLTVETREAD